MTSSRVGIEQWSRSLWAAAEGVRHARALTCCSDCLPARAPRLPVQADWNDLLGHVMTPCSGADQSSQPRKAHTPVEPPAASRPTRRRIAFKAPICKTRPPLDPISSNETEQSLLDCGPAAPAAKRAPQPANGEAQIELDCAPQRRAKPAPLTIAAPQAAITSVLARYAPCAPQPVVQTPRVPTSDPVPLACDTPRVTPPKTPPVPVPPVKSRQPVRPAPLDCAPSAQPRNPGPLTLADCAPSPPPSNASPIEEWKRQLAGDASKRLTRVPSNAAPPRQPVPCFEEAQAPPTHWPQQPSRHSGAAAFQQQFCRTLEGAPATLDLLLHCLNLSRTNEATQTSTTPGSASRTVAAPLPQPAGTMAAPLPVGPVINSSTAASTHPTPPVLEQEWRQPDWMHQEDPLHPSGLASPSSAPAPDIPLSVTPGAAQSVTRVFPPSASPVMPPLLPAKVTRPPAFGLAGAVTRGATRPEDAAIEEDDLAALAAKIEIILREEARRHGISIR